MMERYAARTTAQKLGIEKGSEVALIDPPRDYLELIGTPVTEVESGPVTLWFVTDPGSYQEALPRMRGLVTKTKLWIAWPKGTRKGLNQNLIREAAFAVGLVDYKVCSMGDTWSAMLFARRK
jgi:hypothetical protein